MKLSTMAAAAAALSFGGMAAAQDLPPAATMQPIPNPPEKPAMHHGHHKAMSAHKGTHHKEPAKAADDASKK